MSIYVGNSEIKNVYIGTTPVKEVYVGTTKVRPSIDTNTFTISRTEQSNMSSGWTYSDGATGLTAGSTAFDEFFGYSGVRLSTAGVETSQITQTASGGAGKLDITQLGTLTSGDNVMIKFPVRGIKMTKSGSTVTLSITKTLGRESEGYQYYAHCTGTLSSPGTPKDAFYIGAYKGCVQSNILKSWSNKTPVGNVTCSVACNCAKANGSGYNIEGFYQRMYINALYMMKYGNPNSQSVVGQGISSGTIQSTGGTDSQTNATYGTQSSSQIKLFGLEDRWGNILEWIGGAYTDSSKQLCTLLTGWGGTISGGEGTGTTITTTSGDNLSNIAGNNKAMFSPIGTVSNGSYNTYYSDYVYVSSKSLGAAGGFRNAGAYDGAFYLYMGLSTTEKNGNTGTRLMYLQGLT